MKKVLVVVAALVLLTSTGALAATQAAGTAVVAPTLQISATIQKAVSLKLSTGTSAAPSHCAVTPAGGSPDYTMNFGTVDALAINAGNCNVVAPATPGTDNAIYWSDYTITPVFTSHTVFAGTTITAQVTADFAAPHNIFVVRSSTPTSSTVPAVAGDFAAMGTGSADTIGAAGVVSGTALTRFVGVAVTPANGAVLTGAQTATVTFTLTVQ
jgi:hypothetical protein